MKFRTSFVSNSSSASFIVIVKEKKDFKLVKDIIDSVTMKIKIHEKVESFIKNEPLGFSKLEKKSLRSFAKECKDTLFITYDNGQGYDIPKIFETLQKHGLIKVTRVPKAKKPLPDFARWSYPEKPSKKPGFKVVYNPGLDSGGYEKPGYYSFEPLEPGEWESRRE